MNETLRAILRSRVDPKGYYFEHEKYQIIDSFITAIVGAVEAMPYNTTANHLEPRWKGYISAYRSYERHQILQMLRTQAEGKEDKE